jgi:hypothetical protein
MGGLGETIYGILAYLLKQGIRWVQAPQFIPEGIEFGVRNLRFSVIIGSLIPADETLQGGFPVLFHQCLLRTI